MATTNGQRASIPDGGWRLIANQIVSRFGLSSLLGSMFDGKRPLHEILGYKAELSYRDFKAAYCRQDIAHRLVNAYPEDTWAKPPMVKEDENEHDETPFETAWQALADRLNLYAVMRQADLLANLGRYSVILVGLRGQSSFARPATPVRSPDDLLYFQVYSEEFATIKTWVTNPVDPRFGKPATYNIATGGAGIVDRASGPSTEVHASRIIHLAGEFLLDDEFAAIPFLEPVFDRLTDLAKVVWGSAEMFYRDAKSRLGLELKEGYTLSEDQKTALQEEAEKFTMGMTDFIKLAGITPHDLRGRVASPKDHVDVLIQMVCATRDISKRKLLGSERGELSSAQDEDDWQRSVARRQAVYAAPRIAHPIIQWTLDYGGLPQPTQFQASWPQSPLSTMQQAIVAKDVATAIHTYSQGNGPLVIAPKTFVEKALGWPPALALSPVDMEPEEDLVPEPEEAEPPDAEDQEPETDEEAA